jgi:hypothetical protein
LVIILIEEKSAKNQPSDLGGKVAGLFGFETNVK